MLRLRPPASTLFPYTTLFRSALRRAGAPDDAALPGPARALAARAFRHRRGALRVAMGARSAPRRWRKARARSEEHTSELQSRRDLVCRLLLEKKNVNYLFHVR